MSYYLVEIMGLVKWATNFQDFLELSSTRSVSFKDLQGARVQILPNT